MPVSPFSRYKNLPFIEVEHASRGQTRSLPVRRQSQTVPTTGRKHRFNGFEDVDLLALKHFGREELYWHLLDANGGRLPDDFEIGEIIMIPPLDQATRVQRPGR